MSLGTYVHALLYKPHQTHAMQGACCLVFQPDFPDPIFREGILHFTSLMFCMPCVTASS